MHGMPAILSAILSAIYASLATTENYKESMVTIFPAMGTADYGTTGIFVKEFLSVE